VTANTLTHELTHLLAERLRAHGVVRAAVFGSLARGTARDDSDIDLLVEFAEGRGLFDLAALELDLSDVLDRRVEVVTYRSLDPHMRERVLREQVVIL